MSPEQTRQIERRIAEVAAANAVTPAANKVANTPDARANTKRDRKDYMRAFMRAKRAANAKAG